MDIGDLLRDCGADLPAAGQPDPLSAVPGQEFSDNSLCIIDLIHIQKQFDGRKIQTDACWGQVFGFQMAHICN